MKQALLKHYGKVLLTILLLGAGSYFHVDVSTALNAVTKYFGTPAVSAPAVNLPDAGL